MGYDLHFECGRHEWYNIWTMELFSVLLMYALRKIDRDELDNRLMIIGMERNKALGKRADDSEIKRDDIGKPKVSRTIHLEKFSGDDLKHLPFVGNITDGFAYGARIEYHDGKPSEEQMAKDAVEMRDSIMIAISNRERMDEYVEKINLEAFTNLVNQTDGLVVPHQAMQLTMHMMNSVRQDSSAMRDADETVPEAGQVVQLIGVLAYSGGGNIPFRVS
jgi:hypothetical protein